MAHHIITPQVASKMKGRLVSIIAIFLIISLEMMGGAEGKPQPGPQPAPAPQPAPGPWWSGFGPALHRRRFRRQHCWFDDYDIRWRCVYPRHSPSFGIWG